MKKLPRRKSKTLVEVFEAEDKPEDPGIKADSEKLAAEMSAAARRDKS